MPVKKPALGRGLDAIFGSQVASPAVATAKDADADTGDQAERLRQIPIDQIHPNPHQPRNDFDPVALEDLTASIREKGILQPLLLRPRGDNYQIVAGERRWRSAQRAGLERVPAVIMDFDDREMLEAALIENLQREDLNPVEEAEAFAYLIEEHHLTQEEMAKRIGKSRVAVANSLRLLRLPPPVLELLKQNKLSAGHARSLITVPTVAQQISLAKEIVSKGLSVRDIERKARKLSEPKEPRGAVAQSQVNDDVTEIQEKIASHLGLKVKLAPKSNTSGKIEIFYSSVDEFQRLCEKLGLNLDQGV